jgi:hypothetical protein
LHGAASHIAAGLSREASTRTIQAVLLASMVPHDERWQARFNDVPRTVASAYEKFARASPQPEQPVVQGLSEWDAGDNPGVIPPREWLLGNQFCRGFISSIVAAGGAGKSALRIVQFISLAYSSAPSAGEARAAWRVVRRHCPDRSEEQCREIIRMWVDTGLLETRDYHDPVERKPRGGLFVNNAKRPGSLSL